MLHDLNKPPKHARRPVRLFALSPDALLVGSLCQPAVSPTREQDADGRASSGMAESRGRLSVLVVALLAVSLCSAGAEAAGSDR